MPTERSLYPRVAKWLSSTRHCFHTAVNTGLRHGRIDVVGVRDVGGELSGEIETFSVEVKRGSEPFATASGQALGYKVYAERVYLADLRKRPFTSAEIEIASHLGVGLIRIAGRQCHEELSSPYHRPILRMNLLLLERMGMGRCQLCGSYFQLGDVRKPAVKRYSRVSRENIKKARAQERGMMFWNREVDERKRRTGVQTRGDDLTYERRFLCPDCVEHVLGQLMPDQ